jgi:hypothetical protein
MSHIDFDSFKARRPDLKQAWYALEHWRRRNPNRQYMDLKAVAALDRDVPTVHLLAAVEILLNAGVVRQVYKVVDPVQHVPVGDDFDSPLSIPPKVRGRFDQWVQTADAEIVPLLKEA